MAAGDLVTLAALKSWLNITTSNSDTELARLITAASNFVRSYTGRSNFLVHSVSERRNGTGTQQMMLRDFPVISVSSLIMNDQAVPSQPVGQSMAGGYFLDAWDGADASGPQLINLVGYRFYRGIGNVLVTYEAGFQFVETDTVPVGGGVIAPQRSWAAPISVTYANGTPLTQVPSSPSTGHYSIDAAGAYTFAIGDAGQSVILTYSYTPEDLAHGTLEMIAERFKTKSRIGEMSHVLGGQETVSFSQKDMNDFAHLALDQYRLVAPIGR